MGLWWLCRVGDGLGLGHSEDGLELELEFGWVGQGHVGTGVRRVQSSNVICMFRVWYLVVHGKVKKYK
jgi:hypothetical protein